VGINEISLGLSGAIPGELAREVAEALIKEGVVRRSWLGLTLQPLLKDDPVDKGALVASVAKDSPAEQAGVQAGDRLVSYAGRELRARYAEELPEINRLMLGTPPGTEVELRLLRGQRELKLAARPVARGAAQGEQAELPEWGLSVRELTMLSATELDRKAESGVLVGSVRPGGASQAARPALQAGDILVELGGQPVRTIADLQRLTADAVRGRTARVPALVGFERRSQRLLTVVKLGRPESRDRSAEAIKAWLPITTQVLTTDLAEALGQKGKTGVRVTHVTPSSSAERAGLRVGDLLLRLDGEPIAASQPEDAEVFASLVRQYRVGAQIALDLVRGGQASKVTAELEASPRAPRELPEYRDEHFDFTARELTFQDRLDWKLETGQRGVLVTGVESGGWGALAQLAVGDVVLTVDGTAVDSLEALEQAMQGVARQRPRHVVLQVRRGVGSLFLELEPTWAN